MSALKPQNTRALARGAIIAALYTALTVLLAPLSYGEVQIRFSEAFTLLPMLMPEAVPALLVGCLLANILTACAPLDIALGPVATLLGALGAYFLSKVPVKWNKWLAPVPNILFNIVIVTIVVFFCYTDPAEMVPATIPVIAGGVALGEVVTGYGLGILLLLALNPVSKKIFPRKN